MQAYQERVVVERDELKEKLEKLRAFNSSHLYEMLPYAERGRLTRQALAMTEYLDVLNQRIAAFGGPDAA